MSEVREWVYEHDPVASAKRKANRIKEIKTRMVFDKVMTGTKIKNAMIESGFGDKPNPHALTRTKTWKALMDEFVPDDLLVNTLKSGLGATKYDSEAGEREDFSVRHKYLETGLKLKGKLKDPDERANNTINFFGADQLRRIAGRVLNGDTALPEASDRLPDSDE
jgi:hypothetical protein